MRCVYEFIIVIILAITTSLSCNKKEEELPSPKVVSGFAKISGEIINGDKIRNIEDVELRLVIVNSITGDFYEQTKKVGKDNRISFDSIPIEISPAIGYIEIESLSHSFFVTLDEKESATFKIFQNKNMSVDTVDVVPNIIIDNLDYFINSLSRVFFSGGKEFEHLNSDSINRFINNPSEYISYALSYDLEPRMEQIEEDTILSKKGKSYIKYSFYPKYISSLFNFIGAMQSYHNAIKEDGDTAKLVIENPDIDYYSFMKRFSLNTSQYLYSSNYTELVRHILYHEAFNIPAIEDQDINVWLKDVKYKLKDLVGFDKGLFYDMLIVNAYLSQFSDALEPLSEIQKKNIQAYFKGNEFERILFRRNEEIEKNAIEKRELVIAETPNVAPELLIKTITGKHRGKTIIVDFWATWCVPCLKAIEQTSIIKNKLKDKDVVFIYVANSSSPKGLWNEKIKGIGGEHYYLSDDNQWDCIMNQFEFSGVPSYLIYDKEGELVDKFKGYPGNDELMKKIDKFTK